MMQRRNVLIAASVAAVILVAGIAFVLLRGKDSAAIKLPDHQFENWDAPIAGKEGLVEEAFTLFDEPGMMNYADLVKRAKEGRINLISEIWRLRRQCPEKLDRYQCNTRIRLFLAEKFPPPGSERLSELFKKYLRYEEAMMEFKIPDNLSMRERYSLIQKKRRELFGEEDERLVFGLEESKVQFTFNYGDFIKNTAGLSGDARLKSYEQMRRQTYGSYYDAVVEAEPAYTKYETEAFLREADFKNARPEDRTAMTQAMRERYFGRDGAARMALVDKQIADEQGREKQYLDAEAKFLRENASLSQAQKDARLTEMRTQILGSEAAEEFDRRRKYQESMDKLKNQ